VKEISAATARLTLGVLAEPELADLPESLAEDLADHLDERFGEVRWEVVPGEEALSEPYANPSELLAAARRRLLDEDWDLIVCLTKLPLRSSGRPVIAQASAMDGVGVISVPALGALRVERRVRRAILNLVEGLVGEPRAIGRRGPTGGRARAGARLFELASPVRPAQARDDGGIRFTTAVIRGNLRLLTGMVRANDPLRVVARLARALVAALGTAAYVLASFGFWKLAMNEPSSRLILLSFATLIATSTTLIVAHDLWERSSGEEDRERVVLFNAATTATIALGVLALYAALFVTTTISALALIPDDFFAAQTGVNPGLVDFLHLSWFATSLATLAGALGSLTESDLSVREAAYGYHPDSRVEEDQDDEEEDE
jgi:hypothetical protein